MVTLEHQAVVENEVGPDEAGDVGSGGLVEMGVDT